MRDGDSKAVPASPADGRHDTAGKGAAAPGGRDGALAAIAAVFAASAAAQALFDAEGACAAATPEFTRRAAASADAAGQLDPAFLDSADMRSVVIAGLPFRLVTLGAGPIAASAAPAAPAADDAVLHAALDAIPAAINVKDEAGRYLFMNTYQAKLWGIDAAAARGFTAAELRGEQSTDGRTSEQRVFESGEAVPFFEEHHVDAEGVARDWLITKLPLRHPAGGRTAGVVTFALDISDRKRLEAALLETKKTAEAASQSKTMFLAQVSHELRTPLNAIIGFTEMMTQEIFGPLGATQYTGYAQDVLKAARHLLGIITDMLDVTRLDAGALALDLAPVPPGDIVAEAGRMVALPASTKGVVLRHYVEPGLPLLMADARRLRQALINLIANAVKFTPEGGTVSFGARRIAAEGAGGRGVELYVEDSGIGMTKDEIAVALMVFGRVREGYAKAQDGTGIGLPLAKALIERHGGRFVIESAPGRGTKIRGEFPRACLAKDGDRPPP